MRASSAASSDSFDAEPGVAVHVAAEPVFESRIDTLDVVLILVFLVGLYTNYTVQLSAKVPFPSLPAGIAGLFLLWRRRDAITPKAFGGLLAVLLAYLLSVLCAPDLTYLPRRVNGLIQLAYSIVIGYALFLTVIQASRSQVATIFLGFSLVLLAGCLLESYGGLRPLSDAARAMLYRQESVYENDLRDLMLYRQVRPKFFASEPASVTFCYALFTFIWLVVSRQRWKFAIYMLLVASGLFAMPGPTLLLMLLLVLPYLLFLESRRNGRLNVRRFLQVAIVATFCASAALLLGPVLFKERFDDIRHGNDPSFFYRVEGPALAARTAIRLHAIAGAGLTGEPFIQAPVLNAYVSSPSYSMHWGSAAASTELLINYFWLHWIYLGVVFGLLVGALVSSWLVTLGVPSAAFCWIAWSIMGQAAGAYVGPTCWAVLFLAGAAAILHQRPAPTHRRVTPVRLPVVDLFTRLQHISYRPRRVVFSGD